MYKYFFFLFGFINISCQSSDSKLRQDHKQAVVLQEQEGLSRAYFASGCFWCVEAIYESLMGIKEVYSGYSGGKMKNPSYRRHGDHAETVEIIYNPKEISFASLVDVYFASQNITQVNGQGPDTGSSYRSIIFYQNQNEKATIDYKISQLNQLIAPKKVAAEVMAFEKFWMGEDYHQDFEARNPEHPYINNVSQPRLRKFKAKYPELLKTSEQ